MHLKAWKVGRYEVTCVWTDGPLYPSAHEIEFVGEIRGSKIQLMGRQ